MGGGVEFRSDDLTGKIYGLSIDEDALSQVKELIAQQAAKGVSGRGGR